MTLLTVYPPLETRALRPGAGRGAAEYPFAGKGTVLTHLGRGAVWLALRAVGAKPGLRVAMPAYHCGSEVEAARLAGVEVEFYRVDSDLRADEEDLARAAAAADVVYVTSFFGFPLPPVPAGAVVVADVAHGLFSRDAEAPLGQGADATVFCPRKTLGVPDGGAVVVRDGIDPSRASGPPPWRRTSRSLLALLATRSSASGNPVLRAAGDGAIARFSRGDAAARAGSLTETVIGEWDLTIDDMEVAARSSSRLTAAVVSRVDAKHVRTRRRANYEALLAALAPLVPPPFRSLPAGACPLYLPVRAGDRPAAIAALLERGIRAIEVWPVPHPLLDRARFAELEPARRELLALPVHQSLRDDHVERIRGAAVDVLHP